MYRAYLCIKCFERYPPEQMIRCNEKTPTGECRRCWNRQHYVYQLRARALWTPAQWEVFRAKRRRINRAYRARVGVRRLQLRGAWRRTGLTKEG